VLRRGRSEDHPEPHVITVARLNITYSIQVI
jgi:hypothetical protein